MEKFSYALEFYKNNIFSLDNVKLFKFKIKEAEEIEKYFSQVILNVEYIRKYILRSYLFDKRIRGHRRIAYIKGLILGENYLDFNDIVEFSDFISETLLTEPKMSLWKYKGYLHDTENEDFFEGTIEDNNENEIIVVVPSDTMDYEQEMDGDVDEGLEEIKSSELNKENSNNIHEIIDNKVDSIEDSDKEFIPMHPKEKLTQFRKLKQIFIDETIKTKKIDKEEVSIVKKGMNDWINYILTSMKDIYKINEYTLRFNDENIGKYL